MNKKVKIINKFIDAILIKKNFYKKNNIIYYEIGTSFIKTFFVFFNMAKDIVCIKYLNFANFFFFKFAAKDYYFFQKFKFYQAFKFRNKIKQSILVLKTIN